MSDEIFYTYNVSDFEMKEEGGEVYVSGFISAFEIDEHNDIASQDELLEKINDPHNELAKNLSYKHKWLRKDMADFENKLGVMVGKAEKKVIPETGQPGVWATYHLLKTSPYYDSAVYDIKNKGVTGFSIEFKDVVRKLVTIGGKMANYLQEYFLGGVGLVARPSVKSTQITGFYTKDMYINVEGEDVKMETKEAPVAAEPVKPEVTKEDIEKQNAEIKALQEQVAKEKSEIDLLKNDAQKEKLKKELESLQAEKKVLAPAVGEQKQPGTLTAEKEKIAQAATDADKLKEIANNHSESPYNRARKILDITTQE